MGGHLVATGATFRLWAPHATSVHVRGTFNEFAIREDAALVPAGDGHWHGFIPGAEDRDAYKYWVTGAAGPGWKRDPYARELRVPEWSCLLREPSFPWHESGFRPPPFHELIIYQLHVGAFRTPAWPRRAGTFLDVADSIPYLAELGVTALQLLPIQEFPGDFSLGYNGVDYFSPEMAYAVPDEELAAYADRLNAVLVARGAVAYEQDDLRGEMNQLKALVDLAHLHGIAVIFDLVYNHAGGGFGEESLWFLDRQIGFETPLWWNSLYFSDQTWAGGVVFDFKSVPVRDFLIRNAVFFLEEYRVDGFRFDEVSVIDHHSYGRGWDFCQDLTRTLRDRRPDALLHAEYWPVNAWIVKPPAEGGAGFDSTMTDGPRKALREVLASASVPGDHAIPLRNLATQLGLDYLPNRWRGVNSLENHDLVLRPKDDHDHGRMPRIARIADPSNARSWYARSRSRVATGLLLTMPGIPMLFMGQEFLEDKPWSDDVEGSPELRLFWNGLEGADPSMRDFLRFTRELIHLRRRLGALQAEGYSLLHVDDADRVLAFQRWIPGEGKDVIVVASFANATKHGYEIGFPGGGTWRECFNSDIYDHWVNPWPQGNGGAVVADRPGRHGLSHAASLTIPANSLLVFARS